MVRRLEFDAVLKDYADGYISKGEALHYLSSLLLTKEKEMTDRVWFDNVGYVPC